MFKLKITRKIIALISNLSLLLNSFIPFILASQPAYAQNLEETFPTITYNQSANKLNVFTNSKEIAYQLFYKTDDKIDAIAGNDLNQSDFYLGTCSNNSCLPQNVSRGVLKTNFSSQSFTLENNVLTIVKSNESSPLDSLTTEEENFLNNNNDTNWTFKNVELNKEYIAPQNSQVKLTFTKLPNNFSNIKIEEITLTKEQIEQTGSLSDKAYDITSDMEDGTFAYNLSLPIPESLKGNSVDVKFAEDINEISSAQTVDNTTETNNSISVKNLDHFTIFVITGISTPDCTGASITPPSGTTACYATIQEAINAASPGETINVAMGTYLENLDINKSVTISGTDKNTTIIDGNNSGVVVTITSSNVILKNFTIKNSGTNINTDAGIGLVGVTGVTIENNTITNNVTGIAVMSSSNNNVKNNVVKNSARYGIVLEKHPSVPSFSTSNIISGNTITVNARDGIYVGQDCNGNTITNNSISGSTGTTEGNFEANGIYFWKSSGNTITGNNITNNVAFGIEMKGSSNNIVNNNTITGNKDGLHIRNDTSYPITGNNISKNKIYNNSRVNLYTDANQDTNFNVENNWWGSAIESEITAKLAGYGFDLTSTTNTTPGTLQYIDYSPWYINTEMTVLSNNSLTIPTVTSPIGLTNDNTPLMQWEDVVGATGYYYRVRYNCADINNSATCGSIYPNSTGLWLNSSEYQAGRTNDGVYYWQVQSCSSSDNCSNWSNPSKTIIDSTPPSTPILQSPLAGAYVKGNPEQRWSPIIDADHYVYESYKDTDTSNPTNFIYTETNVKNNYRNVTGNQTISFYWRVKSVDAAGNSSPWSELRKINVDNTPPIITLGTYTTAPTNQNITVTATTNEGTLDVGSTTFTANGSFDFIATDAAGNITIKTVTITNIDKSAPSKPVFTSPTTNLTNINAITLKWDGGDDTESGVKGYIFRYVFNPASGGSSINWSSGFVNTTSKTRSGSFGHGQGTYTMFVKIIDNAGNESLESDALVITYDATAPIITVNPYITNDKTPVLTGTVNDNSATISVKIGTNTFPVVNNGTGNWTLDNIVSNIADGTYDVIATATDAAGNIGTDATTNELTIDSVAPNAIFHHYINETLFTGPIAYVNNLNKLTFTAEYTDATPSSGLLKDSYVIFDAQADHSFKFSQNGAKAYCSWRTEPNLVGGLSGTSFSLTTPENFSNCVSSLADGEYYMTHQVYDNAIRQDIPSITQFRDVLGLHFIIDTVNPTSVITTPTNLGTGSTLYINDWDGSILGTAADNSSGIKDVKISIQRASGKYFDGTGFNSNTEVLLDTDYTNATGTWKFDGLTNPIANSYIIRSHAIDNADNMESTYTITVILDKTIPEVNISLNPTNGDASNGWYQTQPEITLTATDDVLTDKIEYQWDSEIGTWTTYSTSFKPATQGAHVLYYRAIDKAGNVSTVGIKNIKWDQTDLENGPQNISANPNPTSGSTSQIRWDIATDNTGIDKYEVQWKLNGSDNPYYSKVVGSGTTGVEIDQLTEGRWTVKVIAFDQSGRTKDNSIDVVVDRTGPSAPTLTLTSTGTGTATLSWNAIDDAKDYIIWYGSVSGVHQYGARVGNVTSYTVKGLGTGNYYFIIKAVDAAQNQSSDSNEVNTGNIVGAVGTTPGQPAEGFSPEVLGAATEATATPTQKDGETLGVSDKETFDWWKLLFLLFLIPIYFGGRKIFRKK